MKIGVLGPKGSFTDQASDYTNLEKEYFFDIESVINAVKNELVDKGIIPIENSLHGTVIASLDGIKEKELFVEKAIILPIHHCIAGVKEIKNPISILSHPQAIAQCKNYIKNNYGNVEIVETNSTSEAFCKVKSDFNTSLAIGSIKAAKNYGLKIICKNIEDEPNNKTKFFVISKEQNIKINSDKTFIVVLPTIDQAGLLYNMLSYFNKQNINLTKIESRPSRKKLGNYLFYIEFDGNLKDENVKQAITDIKNSIGIIQIIGCYKEIEL